MKTAKKLRSALRSVLHDPLMTEQVFKDNEIKANQLISRSMITAAVILLFCWLLNAVGVLEISRYVLPIFLAGSVMLLLPVGIAHAVGGGKRWVKYLLLVSVTLVLAYLDILLTFNAALMIVLPVVFSCRYYSCQITIKTSILTTVLFGLSSYLGAVINFSHPDMNFISTDMAIYVGNVMLLSFLPRWLIFLVVSAFCFEVARYGRRMVLEQSEITRQAERVNTELEMAGRIQNQALPRVKDLPEKRFRRFDLAAEMIPAKEVGGDFYDFFYTDSTHLAMVIADVADKGVAASLYMMMSKTLLESRLSVNFSPGEVLESVNRQLFMSSPRGMFVTVWVGLLDLKTGKLVTSNAGHEYPFLRRADGDFELIKDPHGFVLGGRKSMKFPEYTIELKEGDTLFLYTDGVPEATAASGEMFGLERMLETLNRHKEPDMEGMIGGVKEDIDLFTSGAPQFDDLTMMAFRLKEALEANCVEVKPKIEEMDTVQEYIREMTGMETIRSSVMKEISIAVDEVFSNIVKYSGADQIRVFCEADEERVKIAFQDNGVPFDPLEGKEKKASRTDTPGGLGILIARRMTDSMEYRYEDHKNVLTFTKRIKEKVK